MENTIKKQTMPFSKQALLVEDNALCRKIMTYYLQKLGYRVDGIDDGMKAIQWIQYKSYSLIIIDIRLNGISGKESIQYVRDSILNTDTPVILWSAFVNKNNEEAYLTWGVDGALIK